MIEEIVRAVEAEKIIVIVRGIKSDKLVDLAEAMYCGGIRLLEITYSADESTSDEETAQNIKMLSEHFFKRMYIGAGTVLTQKQVELTQAAGGRFIISPNTDPKVIKKTKDLRLVSIPGALTPTEIQLAHKSGADFVKLFPITQLGVDYVKAVKAPLSHIRLLAVGGINEHNIADYLRVGICGFGVGSNIVSKRLVEENDFEAITESARKYTQAVRKCQII